MHNLNQLSSGVKMEHHDLKSPMSIILSVLTFLSGLMSLETWAIIIGIICTVVTTITAVRRNRAQEKYFHIQNRASIKSAECEPEHRPD